MCTRSSHYVRPQDASRGGSNVLARRVHRNSGDFLNLLFAALIGGGGGGGGGGCCDGGGAGEATQRWRRAHQAARPLGRAAVLQRQRHSIAPAACPTASAAGAPGVPSFPAIHTRMLKPCALLAARVGTFRPHVPCTASSQLKNLTCVLQIAPELLHAWELCSKSLQVTTCSATEIQ